MVSGLKSIVRWGGMALLIFASLSGCAQDRADLNLVQPPFVRKADLLGKSFYYRRTVVDSPEVMGPYATVGTGDLFTIERLRFEIQERYLLGYRDYEYAPNTQEEDFEGTENFQGTPVVAFPIIYHFDIARRYNPATGEETNVIDENAFDRQWFERNYIRVAWNRGVFSSNYFILPVDFLDTDGEGAHFYIHEHEATDPYRARIEPNNGYIDFVTNHFAVPDPWTCVVQYDFNYGQACGSGEIRVRHAFMTVDEEQNNTFLPLNMPDNVVVQDENGQDIRDPETGEVLREPVWERFGYYRLNRLAYDRERGFTETNRLNPVIRFNIWERSIDDAGTEIPYPERTVRPIVYYLNYDFPSELMDAAFEVAEQWNDVFKQTVSSLQNTAMADTPDVFVLRRNACSPSNLTTYLSAHPDVQQAVFEEVGEPLDTFGEDGNVSDRVEDSSNLVNWCAATEYHSQFLEDRFVWQQNGDPRFNMMFWINNIVPAAFSGYGPMLGDPTNGRNVVSAAYVLGWTIDAAAQRALEYVQYINDELTLGDLLTGSNVPNTFFQGDFDPIAFTKSTDDAQRLANHSLSADKLDQLNDRFRALGHTKEELLVPIENSSHFAERLARVRNTDVERDFLLRPEDYMLASQGQWTPGMPISDDLYHKASMVNRVEEMHETQNRRMQFLAESTMCPHAELDGALVGLAKKLRGLPLEEQRLELRKSVFKAVMLHEVGHNVGLRHNFEASWDALNWPRQFWDIEQTLNGDEEAKLDAQQPEFKYSSIMDYHGRTNADFQGLAHYDAAAIKFGYGQLIEQFNNAPIAGKALRDWRFSNDYKKLPTELGGVNAMYDRRDVIFDWTKVCGQPTAPTDGTCLDFDDIETLKATEVPYLFCSDEFAQRIPTCRRFDFGANHREIQENNYIRYKNYFIFTNYLRNRLRLDFGRAVTRGFSAFRDIVLTYQWMYLYRSENPDFFTTDLGADMATATADGINFMNEVIAMPQPTTYFRCVEDLGGGQEEVTYFTGGFLDYDPVADASTAYGPDGEVCDISQTIGLNLNEGYPMFFGFSEDLYEWTFTYLGVYWDKVFAVQELADPFAMFFRRNQEEDIRTYSVSLYRVYEQEVNDIMLDLIEYDRKGVSVYWDEVNERVVPPEIVAVQDPAANDMPRIVAGLTRNLQRFPLLYGMAFLTSPFDDALDFAKHARVVVKGGPDDFFDTANVTGLVECTLPEGGVTYRAHQTSSENSRIDIARNFVTTCAENVVARQAARVDMEAAELLLEGTSETDPLYVERFNDFVEKELEYDIREIEMRASEQTLEYLHRLNQVYGFGVGL